MCFKSKNKVLELTYDQSAGIPFKWEFEIGDESIVKFDKRVVIRNDNKRGLCGGKIVTKYIFKGLKEGETTITFRFIEFTVNKISKEEVHHVKVDEKNKIYLIND